MPPTLPALPMGLSKTWVISPVSTMKRRVTTRQSVPSQEGESQRPPLWWLELFATLECVPCIRYPVWVWKDQEEATTVTIAMTSFPFADKWERFDFPETLLLADAGMVFHLQQCRHTICRAGACLDNLHGCGRPSGWNSLIRKNLRLQP